MPNLFLQSLRESADLTQTQLGKMIGMNQKHYSRLETGDRDPTNIQMSAIMMAVFICNSDELFDEYLKFAESIHENT